MKVIVPYLPHLHACDMEKVYFGLCPVCEEIHQGCSHEPLNKERCYQALMKHEVEVSATVEDWVRMSWEERKVLLDKALGG